MSEEEKEIGYWNELLYDIFNQLENKEEPKNFDEMAVDILDCEKALQAIKYLDQHFRGKKNHLLIEAGLIFIKFFNIAIFDEIIMLQKRISLEYEKRIQNGDF